MPITYGYARVSTTGQALDAQLASLTSAGCVKIFREKISGANRRRPELKRLLRALRAGDMLLVTRIDRLARSTRDLLNILSEVSAKKVGFRALLDAWADTTTPYGRLCLIVLAGVAEFERELILARTGEGRARALAKGVRFGRRPKLTSVQREIAMWRIATGEPRRLVALSYNVSPSTISRLRSRA